MVKTLFQGIVINGPLIGLYIKSSDQAHKTLGLSLTTEPIMFVGSC